MRGGDPGASAQVAPSAYPFESVLGVARRESAENEHLPQALLDLLWNPEEWIRRRVERLKFASWESITSAVSLDVWIDPLLLPRLRYGAGRILVPVGFGTKGIPISRFELSADGGSASLLSSGENAVLSTAVIEVALQRLGFRVGAEQRERIEVLCGPLAARDEAHDALARWVRTEVAARPVAADEGDGVAAALRWLTRFRDRYVLYASVASATPPTSQRSIKLAHTRPNVYGDEARPSAPGPAPTGDAAAGERPGPGQRPFEGPFSSEADVGLALTDMGYGARYHVDIEIPSHIRAHRAVLERRRPDGASEALCTVEDVDWITLETPAGGLLEPGGWDDGFVSLSLKVERRGVHAEAFAFSMALALSVVLGAVFFFQGHDAPGGVLALVAVPLVPAMAVLFRPSPDQITQRLTRATRGYLMQQSAVTSLWIAAVALGQAFAPRDDLPETAFWTLRIVVLVAVLLVSAVYATIQWQELKKAALDR